jgi:phosphomevalonate kinase
VDALLVDLLRVSNWSRYNETLKMAAELAASEWATLQSAENIDITILQILIDIHTTFQDIRKLIRKMGNYSKTPIEPPFQTHLCDETQKIAGVLFAGVPGAGGDDAIFALALESPEGSAATINRISAFWENFEACDQSASGRKIRRLPVTNVEHGLEISSESINLLNLNMPVGVVNA